MRRSLALSVLLHAALLGWVATRPPRVLPAVDRPLELALVEVTVEKPPEPQTTPAPPPPAPRRRPPPSSAAAPAPQALPPEPPSVAPAPPAADMPRAEPRVALMPSLNLGGAGVFAVSPPDGGVEALVQRAPSTQQMLSDLTRQTLGMGRVERGMVHPYYQQLGKVLIKTWDADRAVKAHGLKGYFTQAGENMQTYNGIWQSRAEQYAKGGSPFVQSADLPMRPMNDRIPYGMETDFAAKQEMRRQMASEFKAIKRALVRVVQDRDGKLLKVELVQPSRDENIDREALADVRAAAANLPPPPEEVTEGKDELSSIWQFELVVSITPPVPTFTFEFDEVLGFVDARMPLDRRIYKKVKLVSVE